MIGVGYCRAHLRSRWGLDITPADNPTHGLRLRAVGDPDQVIFKKGENIAYYNGEEVTKQEMDARYGNATAPYGIRYRSKNPNTEWYEDAACRRGVGSLANHKSRSQANATFAVEHKDGDLLGAIKAVKPIKGGQEIFVDYNNSKTNNYQFNKPGVSYSTSIKNMKFL